MAISYKENQVNGKQRGPDGKLYVIPGGPLDPAAKNNKVEAPKYFEGATDAQKAAFDKGIEFVNVGGGVFQNRMGQYVDAGGRATTAPPPVAPKSMDDRASDLLSGQLQDQQKLADELGLDTQYPTTFEGIIQERADAQAREAAQARAELERQKELIIQQAGDVKKSAETQIAGVKSALAQDREGPFSVGNVATQERTTAALKEQIDRAIATQNAALQKVQNIEQAIKDAERQGNRDLVDLYQGQLEAAKFELTQADTALLDAQVSASEEARAVQEATRQNFETFTSFVNEGQTLTVQGIKNLAGQLNIDFESAFDYYQSVENIRVDKSLSQTEKEIALQDAALELDRKMTNRDLLEVRKVDYLTSLYQSGASQEEISAYKQLAGITDENDPLYQAELRIKQADAKVKEMQAAGELPVGSTEWLEREQQKIQLAKEQKEYYDTYGGSWDTDAFQIGEEVGWCGVYASKLSTASSVGDYWYQKKTKIQSQSPTVGDKLLIPIGVSNENADYGHVAVVLGYDSETGIIQVAESNKDGRQNKGTGLGIATFGTYTVDELNAKYGSEWGVAHGDLKDEYKSAYNPSGNKPKLEPKEVQKLDKELRSTDEYKSLNKSNKSLSALLEFERIWKESGEDLDFIGKDVGKLRTSYRTALLELKEYFNLGVLNGPDLQIMEEIMPDPTSLSERGAALIGRGGADAVTAGIENLKKQLYSSIDERYETINEIYGSYEGQLDSLASLKRKFGEAGIDTEILQSGEKSVPTINPATTPTLSKYGVSADYDSIIDNNN